MRRFWRGTTVLRLVSLHCFISGPLQGNGRHHPYCWP